MVDFSVVVLVVGVVCISFIQGIGYAIATWFFNKRIEKHFNLIEEKLKIIKAKN